MAANEQPAWYATATESAPARTSGWDVSSEPAGGWSGESRRSSKAKPEEAGVFRQVVESLACLAVAVIVFRAFLLEGYIISTGSMAPSLLGYHKQVVCPDCGYEFAFGVAFDRPSTTPSELATCPNCGQGAIDVSNVPRNDGDQLLVSKYAYLFNDPHRWQVVVFLNPNNPNQAYVKRVVGLPGETIHVRDGDVYIDGRILRKTMAQQRAIRIPVFDQKFQASDSTWIPRWMTDAEWAGRDATFSYNDQQAAQGLVGTGAVDSQVRERSRPPSESISTSWVRYFHWPRLSPYTIQARADQGEGESARLFRPGIISDNYGYNQPSRISEKYRVNDLMLAAQLTFPGRNSDQTANDLADVRREAVVDAPVSATGEFVARLSCRSKQIVCRIDADARVLELWIVGSSAAAVDAVLAGGRKADATVPLKEDWFKEAIDFELSSFDRQAAVAVNGVELAVVWLEGELRDVPDGSWSEHREGDLSKITIVGYSSRSTLQAAESRTSNTDRGIRQTSWTDGVDSQGTNSPAADPANSDLRGDYSSDEQLSPVAFGARRGSVQVQSVTLYRDVHYTTENHRHATDRPLTLGDDEFFFLGDNSPVSLDSRGWVDPVVPRRLLVGRPLIVHLPSFPGRLKIGSTVKYIRIPDFSKIRCIR
ncbi:MAG: signal peptidase I [Rhodopirellula sp.]|nr:signal peptidase I [Rhodopirellula sp.]